jgi:transposase-like protein
LNGAVVIATGVSNYGRRELLGFDVITSEDGRAERPSCAAWWPAASRV